MAFIDDDFSLEGHLAKTVRRPGTYHTFDEWSEMGFKILAGEHHHLKNEDGVPMFHESQVERSYRHDGRFDGFNFYSGYEPDDEINQSGIGQFDGELPWW